MKRNANLIQLADQYFQQCMIKISYIKKLPNGQWRVFSESGKNMGTYDSPKKAKDRLRQIEFFKHKKAGTEVIDLTELSDLSFSAIMRELRQQTDDETVHEFLKTYKNCFDRLVENDAPNLTEIALFLTLKLFGAVHPLKIKIKKEAAPAELGDPTLVGRYLADIIRFTLSRISPENRAKSMANVIRKIYLINESELANKNMPNSAAIGQAIGFVKQVLLAHDPRYIRQVINNIVAYLR